MERARPGFERHGGRGVEAARRVLRVALLLAAACAPAAARQAVAGGELAGALEELKSAFEAGGAALGPRWDDALKRARALAVAAGGADQRAWVESLDGLDRVGRSDFEGGRASYARATAYGPPTLPAKLAYLEADLEFQAGRLAAARARVRAAERELDRHALAPDEERRLRASCAGLDANIALRLGQPDVAAAAVEREAAHLVPGDSRDARFEHAVRQADVAQAVEDFARVIRVLDAHVALAREIDEDRLATLLVRRGIAESEQAREGADPARAETTLREALALEAIDARQAASARRVLTDLALRRGDLEAARVLLDVLERDTAAIAGSGTPAAELRALVAAQRVQLLLADPPMQSPAQRASLAAARDALASGFEAVCRAFEREREGVTGIGTLGWGTQRAVLSELVRADLALEPGAPGEERALSRVVRAQCVGGMARALGASDASAAEVRAALTQGGAGVLVLVPAMDRTHVFAVDAERIVYARAQSRDRIREAGARTLVPRLTTPPQADPDPARRADDLRRMIAELTRDLLPDAIRARIAGWTEVRVAGADLCGNPPVEFLLLPDGRELGLVLPVTYLPSLPAGARLARRAEERAAALAPGRGRFVAVIDPTIDAALARVWPRLVPLDVSDDEVERLAGDGVVLRGMGATPAALAQALGGGARFLLALAHGVQDPAREQPAGLVLAATDGDPGVLWCDAVSRLASPPFVALIACETARGRARLGDDAATHLGGAFLAAGADCVVASRGDVALDTGIRVAEILRERVHERGEAPASALLAARVALARDPATADPFHRAGLVLYGCGPAASAPATAESGDSHGAAMPGSVLVAGGVIAAALALIVLAGLRVRTSRG